MTQDEMIRQIWSQSRIGVTYEDIAVAFHAGLNFQKTTEAKNRKIIQISSRPIAGFGAICHDGGLFALCDDGSLWFFSASVENEDSMEWERLPDIPQN